MVKSAPKIDRRTAAEIADQVQELLVEYAPSWQEFDLDPLTDQRQLKEGISAALIGVFARFAEIIIQRLNQVPDKNFLAFLNLLGAWRFPPQPARVPLTFSLATGSTIDAVVPAGTQVAAPPAEGEKDPVVFETERDLVVTAAELTSVLVRDPEQDTYGDRSSIITTASSFGTPVFRGDQPIEHILYLGHRQLLGLTQISQLRLKFTLLSSPLEDERQLKWEFWDGEAWQEKIPNNDLTENLKQSGTIDLGSSQSIPISTVNLLENRWLRCRLVTPITLATQPRVGMVRTSQLPQIQGVTIRAEIDRTNLEVETAFTNQLPVDLSKDFFPFGEKPKFGDTLYLANREAFSHAATVTLYVTLTNPADDPDSPIPPTQASENIRLKWEFWNGQTWVELGTSTRTGGQSAPAVSEFQDNTQAFTHTGDLSFTLLEPPVPKTVNGVEDFWLRVRIVAGNYGEEARYERIDPPPNPPASEYRFIEATFAPPSISSISVSYELDQEEQPEVILTDNDFVYSENLVGIFNEPNQSFAPFESGRDIKPTLYLGFTLPPGRTDFPNRTISLFNRVADFKYGEKLIPISPTQSKMFGAPGSNVTHKFWLTNAATESVNFGLSILGTRSRLGATIVPESLDIEAGEAQEVEVQVTIPENEPPNSSERGFLQLTPSNEPSVIYSATFETFAAPELTASERIQLSWRYWNGTEWNQLTVRDDSENFTRPGLVEFLPPADITPREEFGLSSRHWLRVQWEEGDYIIEPRLQQLLPNTIMAAQTVTIRNEILGSSIGSENQTFQTVRAPVLEGQHLEVRELELPSAEEQAVLQREEGKEAIPSLDSTEQSQEIWVRWHEVLDFYGSGPRDRHYVLNHLTGEIQFGNGLNGLIPPIGTGNLRMARYQTGGGTAGNKTAGTIVQLKTTVPYVERVTNPEAATGGAEAETLDSLRDRMPRTLRHRGRAVTLEDYEDLAKQASPAVARAKCIPLRNLAEAPLGEVLKPGDISIIIVPRSTDAKPLPSLELIDRVQSSLKANGTPTANVSVVGPLYVSVNVRAEIALAALEGASAVEQRVYQTLDRFLHPLTGGLDGTGWDFGREPYKSDFYALIESVPGVDHIRTLNLTPIEDQADVRKTDHFLVCSGQHNISLVFEKS